MTISGLLWALSPYMVAFLGGDVVSQTIVRWKQTGFWMRANSCFLIPICIISGFWGIHDSLDGTHDWLPFLFYESAPDAARQRFVSSILFVALFGLGCRWGYIWANRSLDRARLKGLYAELSGSKR